MEKLTFRTVRPTDLSVCAEMEAASYPKDEAANKASLQYRQHHAANYFRCAVIGDGDDEDETIIGFVCSTRCSAFEHESMTAHVPNGPLLAIHSVCVRSDYRRKGVATALMKDYVQAVKHMNAMDAGGGSIEKMVLLSKEHLLAFYVKCGFSATGISHIQHGQDQWYHVEMPLDTRALKDGKAYYVADAFADPQLPGTGNPAAVVVLDGNFSLDGENERQWMQTVAAEFNLSETAFVAPVVDTLLDTKEHELHYHIRYFTPKIEVSLCGHATLAASAILFQTIHLKNKSAATIVFHAKTDTLRTSLAESTGSKPTKISMEFPTKPAVELMSFMDQTAIQNIVSKAFKIESNDILYYGISEIGDVLVEVTYDCFQRLGYHGLKYDALLAWDGYERGVIICCAAPERDVVSESGIHSDETSSKGEHEEPVHFYSRFFAPKAGITEDPVTGSAHCVLGPHFFGKVGKEKLLAYQSSERGGLVECEKLGDSNIRLSGNVVTSMQGTLLIKYEE